MPLEGELADIIERRPSIWEKAGAKQFSEYVFLERRTHRRLSEILVERMVAASLGKMICPKCGSSGAERTCEGCK